MSPRASSLTAVPLARHQIGIDENGLGPRLGPMTVTAARLHVDTDRVRDQGAYLEIAERAGIGDSKAACAHGSMAEVEGRVLALLAEHLGAAPRTLAELTALLCIEDGASLKSDCPTGEASTVCFGDELALPAFGAGATDRDREAARTLREAGVVLTGVRFALSCSKRINMARDRGVSRFDLDLAWMVKLAGTLRGEAGSPEVTALCGKVGGRNRYASALESLSTLVGVLDEARARASYKLPGFGEVHFVMDGDATEPSIGLASLVGKYVRELWMERINRYFVAAVPTAQRASGYHDPVTSRLIEATALVRSERAIPDECFERRSLGDADEGASAERARGGRRAGTSVAAGARTKRVRARSAAPLGDDGKSE